MHHGALDTRLAATWPAYDMALTAANVPHEGYIYPDAVHGFNCDATPERYNKAAPNSRGNVPLAGLINTRAQAPSGKKSRGPSKVYFRRLFLLADTILRRKQAEL